MNYEFFSNILRALVCAEDVAIEIQDEALLAKTRTAKVTLMTQFEYFFPSKVEDVLNRPGFSCKPFFEILAEYPSLLEGREKKFLQFIASVAEYAPKGIGGFLDKNVIKIFAHEVIDNYVWNSLVKDEDNGYFAVAVNAVLSMAEQYKRCCCCRTLVDEILPSWIQAFPKIEFDLPYVVSIRQELENF